MTKKEMKAKLQAEHSNQWEFARRCAELDMEKGMNDKEIAKSLQLLSQRIGGICDSAMVLNIDLEKLSEINDMTVSLWRMNRRRAA